MRSHCGQILIVWCLLTCVVASGCRGRRSIVRHSVEPDAPVYAPEVPTAQKNRGRISDLLTRSRVRKPVAPESVSKDSQLPTVEQVVATSETSAVTAGVQQADFVAASVAADQELRAEPAAVSADQPVPAATPAAQPVTDVRQLSLEQVIDSVYRSYPMLQSALLSRNIAAGQQTGAWGAFDTKLKGASENGPVGFYETYRQSVGVVKPTYWGGEVFGGYRIGRGDMQPWYQERVTDDGGEFKAGVQVPQIGRAHV